MTHIIITLPKELWLAICSGKKKYELRKSLPRRVKLFSKIYVVIKGTTYVAGYFTFGGVIKTNCADNAWREYGDKLAISEDWYNNYVQSAKEFIYFWQINGVYMYDGYIDLEEYFGVKHNPQSYVYTDAEPYITGTLVRDGTVVPSSDSKNPTT